MRVKWKSWKVQVFAALTIAAVMVYATVYIQLMREGSRASFSIVCGRGMVPHCTETHFDYRDQVEFNKHDAERKAQVSALQSKAENGDAEAQGQLGAMYEHSVPPNYGEAVKWIRKSAEQGHFGAQVSLARMYEQGRGVDQDYEEAVFWALLAEKGVVSVYIYDLEKNLTHGQIIAIEKRVKEWKPNPVDAAPFKEGQ